MNTIAKNGEELKSEAVKELKSFHSWDTMNETDEGEEMRWMFHHLL